MPTTLLQTPTRAGCYEAGQPVRPANRGK